MKAASAIVRTNGVVRVLSDARPSQRCNSGSVCGESITENIPHQSVVSQFEI